MGFNLIVVQGPDRGLSCNLGAGAFGVGRSSGNTLVLTDPKVSREHLSIMVSEQSVELVVLSQHRSAMVDGREVARAILQAGSSIRLGDTVLLLEDDAAPVVEFPITEQRRLATADYPTNAEANSKSDRAVRDRYILYQAALLLASGSSSEELQAGLAALAHRGIGGGRVFLFACPDGEIRWHPASVVPQVQSSHQVELFNRTVIQEAFTRRSALLCTDTGSGRSKSLSGLDLSSVAAAPILLSDQVLGILYADTPSGERPLDGEDLDLLTALANLASAGLPNRKAQQTVTIQLREEARIIGSAPATTRVLRMIEKVAPTSATVLIRGESGTGKERAAAAIHYGSPRSGRPFVAINCAALSRDLVESELFGHVKGAFTGANTRREGRFVEADTGTLFLDEIGEMELACQAKLLRVLEVMQVTPVGSNRAQQVDVRIIAGTNCDLEQAIAAGTFRSDLYYRLRFAEIVMPPLRERTGDIPILVAQFIQEANRKLGKKVSGVLEEAMQLLMEYPWPGNVRELRNTVEMAMILTDGERLEPTDLPDYLILRSNLPPTAPTALDEVEKVHILQVLEHCGGNKAQAARTLRISKRTLYAKLAAYGQG